MKICLINNLYKPYSRGGADRITEIMHDGLKNKGHDVFVVSTQPEKPSYKDNGNYYIKSFYGKLGGMNKIFRGLFVVLDLTNIKNYFLINNIIKEKADLVITHNLRGIGFLIVLALKKIKHAHILHDIQLIHPSGLVLKGGEEKINGLSAKIYYNLTRKIFGSPDFVISPSNWLLSEHVNRGFFRKSQKRAIPNPALISEKTIPKNQKADLAKFLYVGEVESHKGIFLLIKAFVFCQKYFNNISLDIIGKGSRQADLPRISGINYSGWKTKAEVAAIMADSDCLVMPSFCYENSPTVLYEAAALGLPVIASRIGGTSELAHFLGGLLFNAGDLSDLEKKMIFAVKNPELMKNIGIKSSEKIKKYSVENYISAIERFLAG